MKPAVPYPPAVLRGQKKQRVYRGRRLLQIAMPLGGIGSGCICLNGYGGLQDFSIRNSPANSAEPDRHEAKDAGFALLHLPAHGQTRLVEGPFPPEKIYDQGLRAQGYNGGGFEGLPRFRNCTFQGEYPFGTVQLSDPAIPLKVSVTGFNPFIPLDDVNSGLPCAILEYTLHNRSTETVVYQFSYHLSHLALRGINTSPRSEPISGMGVYFWNEEPVDSLAYASAALGVLDASPVIKARWFRGGWFDAISAIWREVSSGNFKPANGLERGTQPGRNGGSVMLSGKLEAGERLTYPIVITWYFPNMTYDSNSGDPSSQSCCAKSLFHPFYTTQWKDASQVLMYVNKHYNTLRDRTQAFHDALFNSTLPSYVLEAVSANLAILKSPTVLRNEDGEVWAWEGCFSDKGCCPGSCTHVWNYAQAMPSLFPALERTLRQQELEHSMNQTGHINFRAAPPGLSASHNFHAASDGQLGGIMKVYREWQISGDHQWLERIYPLAKCSMDFCIENWDPRHHGLVEEPHHNTYDIEFWGPDGMCSSFYLGALTAMAAMARDAGHPEDAPFYDILAETGSRSMDKELFNGDYYQQHVMVEGLRDTSFKEMLAGYSDNLTDEEQLLKMEGPKYQYGSGCLSDGILGVWLARMCGLANPLNPENIRKHLAAVFHNNFKASLWDHANVQRPGFALGNEQGLLLCTWPHGGKPTLPFVYSDEVWTGIEYQVAAHLIAEDKLQEGLTIVHALRSRYDGWKRNPWNEYECGSYYARAMASYALLIALTGFQYSAPERRLSLTPKIEQYKFQCFFSTAGGWGSITLGSDFLEIKLNEGELSVDTLQITRQGQTLRIHPNLVLNGGECKRVHFNRD